MQRGVFMGLTLINQNVSKSHIGCDEIFSVQLTLAAAPSLLEKPCDIILAVNTSDGMGGEALGEIKEMAGRLIRLVAAQTHGGQADHIGAGNRMGLISFSDEAYIEVWPITAAVGLRRRLNKLHVGGKANHADAFIKARALFNMQSASRKVLILWTDGVHTAGGPSAKAADKLREMGVEIYCVGVSARNEVNTRALNTWASGPEGAHVFLPHKGARTAWKNLTHSLTCAGATDLVLQERFGRAFHIIGTPKASKGRARRIGQRTLRWDIDALGVDGAQGATLHFLLRHTGGGEGLKPIAHSAVYADKQQNDVQIPIPQVQIQCGAGFGSLGGEDWEDRQP